MRLRRKSLICIGIGIGHQNFYHAIDRLIWRMFIALSSGIVVRQKGVAEALGLNGGRNLFEAADMIFSVEVTCNKENLGTRGSVVLALANVFKSPKDDECRKFCDGMGLTINVLIEQGYTVHMIEFTKTLDSYLYDEVIKRVEYPEKIVYHEYTSNPYEVVDIFGNAREMLVLQFV